MINYSVSAVIPVYNEEEYLPKTIQEVYGVLSENFSDFEIIIINDGSNDRSPYILAKFGKEYSCIKVLHNHRNQGLGFALKRGFDASTKDIIFYIDCDLPFKPYFIVNAADSLNEYDLIMGYRNKWDNLLRKVFSLAYDFIIRYMFHSNFTNASIGLKVFKRKILDAIKLKSSGSFISIELLLEAKRKNFAIKSIYCDYRKRLYGRSKLCNINNILQIIFDMFRYYFRKNIIYEK